jgi:7-carboxy-7-deazaguanine synthase
VTYSVKEIFYTLQGEGTHAGRASVFCRFAGCNLWSGQEKDRTSSICQFCDTEFVGTDGLGGGKFKTPENLANEISSHWGNKNKGKPFVVFTGGEPLMQLDDLLIAAVHDAGFEIAVETNGTIEAPEGIDWICVSPKSGSELAIKQGNELKFVFPQIGIDPKTLLDLQFDHYLLQPMDSPEISENTEAVIDYCMTHPEWKLSLQTHKHLGIR